MSTILWSCNNADQQKESAHNHSTPNQEEDSHKGHNHAAEEVDDAHDHGADDVHNHGADDAHDHGADDAHNQETEQGATELDFGLRKLGYTDFQESIRTSGQILSAQGDEITITAVHEGLVIFNNKQLLSGKAVSKGTVMLSISGKDLIHDNIAASYRDAKSNFEIASKDFERAQSLFKDRIIPEKEFLEFKLAYEKASSNFDLIRKNYSNEGQKVIASSDGFIKEVLVSEGQYVTTGQPIIKITKNKRLIVRADVPQRHFGKLQSIVDANFITLYDKQLYKVKELNGKFISYGKSTATNSIYTPLYFEIDNIGNLMAGSFVEIFLKTAPIAQAIIIPKSAILEETGKHYVFVQHHGEYEKAYIEIDCHDGENYHILSGLKKGDVLVTKNPYQIKLASLSSSLPAHSHQH